MYPDGAPIGAQLNRAHHQRRRPGMQIDSSNCMQTMDYQRQEELSSGEPRSVHVQKDSGNMATYLQHSREFIRGEFEI